MRFVLCTFVLVSTCFLSGCVSCNDTVRRFVDAAGREWIQYVENDKNLSATEVKIRKDVLEKARIAAGLEPSDAKAE